MPTSFRERLREAMQRKGLDQRALARETGLSESAVSRHLEREEAPRADSLKKYADALNVSVSWLGYGRAEVAVGSAEAGGRLVGAAALDHVLRDYVWPRDVEMSAIDAAESAAWDAAATPDGQSRSPAAWRAYLDRIIKRDSEQTKARRPLLTERRR